MDSKPSSRPKGAFGALVASPLSHGIIKAGGVSRLDAIPKFPGSRKARMDS